MENFYKSKFLLALLLLTTTITGFAQIPNAGFETWTSGSCDLGIYSYNDATGWGDINSLTCPGGGFTCLEAGAAQAHSGSHALELTTVSIFGQTAPGICATGSINQNTQAVQGGFNLTTITHPDKLIGWYKYAPSPPDTFSISINVYSGATTGAVIGSGSISGTAAVSNYTKFIVNIPYTGSGNGDSAQITIINSAGANGQAGTTMYIDDLSLISCAGFGATPTTVNATCNTTTGSITLGTPVNGTSPYVYNWSNGSTASSVSSLSPGTYKVTITDANTCVSTDSIVISETNVPFTVNATGGTTSCTSNTGTVTVSASGGNSPYTYHWANNSTGAQITGLGAGNYLVTVTDAHGCTTTASGAVTTPNGPTATDVVTNVACYNDSTGTVSVNVSGGTSPITYTWSNSATTANLSNVPAGTYTLVISDNNNCSFEVSATITQPTALVLTGSSTNLTCNNVNIGTAGVTVTGGTSPYTYAWNGGATSSSISSLGAGIYNVVVSDSNHCTASINDTVSQPAALTASIAVTNASNENAGDGTAILTASGGTGTLTYNWVTGATGDTITHLTYGTYCVTVTDANFCTVSACDSVGYGTVGINTISSATVKIYPNPANSQLTIETNTTDGKFAFVIYSLDGKLVEQKTITGEKSTLQLDQFATGFYTYQLKDMINGNINYGKLQIQR